MIYKNYYIYPQRGHYVVQNVSDPEDTWTEDTVQDAKFTIGYITDQEDQEGERI